MKTNVRYSYSPTFILSHQPVWPAYKEPFPKILFEQSWADAYT